VLGDDPALLGRVGDAQAAALRDHAVGEPVEVVRAHQEAEAHRARRLPEGGDVRRVAAEGGDLLAHPAQRGELVAEPDVGLTAIERQEALEPEAVIDRHEHDAVTRERAAVVELGVGRAGQERAAVETEFVRP
jgi:hypothetical protein